VCKQVATDFKQALQAYQETLRNVAATAPCFHDGSVAELGELMISKGSLMRSLLLN
jgi:cytochrome c peroxidase